MAVSCQLTTSLRCDDTASSRTVGEEAARRDRGRRRDRRSIAAAASLCRGDGGCRLPAHCESANATTPHRVTQPEQRLHDANVAGGAIVDRLPLLPRCVDVMAVVCRQLAASLRCDDTASSRRLRYRLLLSAAVRAMSLNSADRTAGLHRLPSPEVDESTGRRLRCRLPLSPAYCKAARRQHRVEFRR